MKTRTKKVIDILMIFMFIISLAIMLTIWNIPLYRFTLRHYNIPEQVGMSEVQILNNYWILLKYLHLPWIKVLSMPDFPTSINGLIHFYEVKRLFLFNILLLIISGLYNFFLWKRVKNTGSGWQFHTTFKRALWVPLIILFILVINFDPIFTLFHQVFFRNDYWIFNPSTDPIILVLPQEFFMFCFLSVFILIELFIWILKEKTKWN